jgi:hypothetical protein
VGNTATLDILIPGNTIETLDAVVNGRIEFPDTSVRIGTDTGAVA